MSDRKIRPEQVHRLVTAELAVTELSTLPIGDKRYRRAHAVLTAAQRASTPAERLAAAEELARRKR